MAQPVRRVVTGHDRGGKAIALIDGIAENIKVREASGISSTLLWVTDETQATFSTDDDSATREVGITPPTTGSIFRVVEFLPESDQAGVSGEDMRREMGVTAGGEAGARHPGMHRTESIDYAVVMSGEIDMLLDDSEVHLKAGDVVVQRGTNHAWANRGDGPCRIAFVLIGADVPWA